MRVSDGLADQIPLGRAGRDTDIAGAALYLASPAGRYVNGATIALDGGWSVAMPGGFFKL
jgi:NAD(P)-dependent dehydrogenase (short-subunit alcohol dehydrogenase family)